MNNPIAQYQPPAPAINTMQPVQPPALLETAATAVASQAKAMVEARYVIALQRPRNWDQVRFTLLNECKRPAFANNKSAWYVKPIGDGVEGLGIRFVEVALRCMTNVLIESSMIFEDDLKEIHRVSVTDLEANITYPQDVRVTKTVERSKPASDGSFISQRKNSYGKITYTIPGTDDDILNKRAAQISKAVRTLGLRIIPGDLQDEAEAIIKQVRLNQAASDPAAERKKILDAFASINVSPMQLEEYLDHGVDTCSPAEIVQLRGIFGAIKDGEATWQTVMDNKAENKPQDKKPAKGKSDAKPAEKPATTDGIPAEDIKAALQLSKNIDELNEAADLIRNLPEDQRAPLNALYDELAAKLQ